MTDAEYLAWLRSSGAIRCVLIEANVLVGGVETTRYLSSMNYVTSAADNPPHRAYLSVVRDGVTTTERINLDGSASVTFGDIEIGNESGSLDSWLGDVWTNRVVTIWSGDSRWPRSQFRQVFTGLMAGISSRDRGTLNIELRDKMQRLNAPLTEAKLGGATENKDRLLPLCFGECHNIEPLLINPATLTFRVHNGPIERIIEVRDNGAPVAFTGDLAAGTFSLAAQPAGLVTASVQGDKPGTYANTVVPIITRLVTAFGKDGDKFTSADIDQANFAAFAAANSQYVGVYFSERTNVIQAITELAESVGARPVLSGNGLLRLVRLDLPAPGTPSDASIGEMSIRTLRISARPEVQAAVKIAYCKNWTVQTTVAAGIPEAHKNLFALEWLTATASSATTKASHKLTLEPEQVDTLLLTEAQAMAEATRRLNLWSVQRTVFAFGGMPGLMLQELASPIRLTNFRFHLDGRLGQVIGITRDWIKCRAQLEVLT